MRFILFLFFLFIPFTISAQVNSDSADKKTSEYFDNGQWNDLIRYSEDLLTKGFDSYFLRARLGVAYFELQKYFEAITNLETAVKFSYNDPFISKYLYDAYVYTRRNEDKDFVFYSLTPGKRRKAKPLENSLVDNLHIAVGKGFANDYDKNNFADLNGADNIYGEQTLNGNTISFSAGINQLPFKWFNISYNYTYSKLSKRKQIQFSDSTITNDYNEIKNNFYNKFDFRVTEGLVISPAAHYLGNEFKTIFAEHDTGMNYSSRIEDRISDDFVLSLDISKYITIFKIGVNGSFSFLNEMHQHQYGFSFRCFPFYKTNFYTNTNLIFHNQNKITNLVLSQQIAGKIYKNLWGVADALIGNVSNFNEQNGLVIYNNPDVTKYKLGVGLEYYFPFNLKAYLEYGHQNRERTYLTEELIGNSQQTTTNSHKLNYSINNLALGFNFSF